MSTDSERACLARLQEMDEALAKMVRELPDDVIPIGNEARKRVAAWMRRIAEGGADLSQLAEAMQDLAGMMDSLTARLLLVPWEGPPGPALKS